MVNVKRLLLELRTAGLPVVGVAEDGRVDYSRDLAEQEAITAAAVIEAHDPTRLLPEEEDEQAASQAKTDFRQLPQWAIWAPAEGREYVRGAVLTGQSADQVEAWINANVTSLATAKTALILLARNLVALRDIVSLIAMAILFLRDVAVRKSS